MPESLDRSEIACDLAARLATTRGPDEAQKFVDSLEVETEIQNVKKALSNYLKFSSELAKPLPTPNGN
jgi:hypothetical protein